MQAAGDGARSLYLGDKQEVLHACHLQLGHPSCSETHGKGGPIPSHEEGKPALSFETTTSALCVLAQTRQAVCHAGVDFAEIILINTQICKLWPDMCSSTLVEMPIPSPYYVKVL